ncbi:kinase-like domain-containing protein [Spinellus fusiger]|nr:kinase-like domain-containing protein [Spinellus fusiger]
MKSVSEDSAHEYTDEESSLSDEEEDHKDYKKGGYHPVAIGDIFHNQRYLIIRKLGWGHFSTVWLAKDRQMNSHVALKIVKSATHYTESALEEVKILERVKAADPNAPGRQYIAQLLDHFWHMGPHGKHMCMAFEVLGQSLLSVIKRYRYKGIPAPMVRRISKQVLEGLDYLHRECGIIHTDLKPENVLVCIPEVEQWIQQDSEVIHGEERVQQTYVEKAKDTPHTIANENSNTDSTESAVLVETPVTSDETMTKSRKKRLKKKMKKAANKRVGDDTNLLEAQTMALSLSTVLPTAALDFSNKSSLGEESTQAFDHITVKIADFGNACWTHGDYTHIIQTRQYRSPEVIVGAKWTERADMWSVACLIFELLTGDYLFDPRSGKKYDKDDDHLGQMVELMRAVPRSLTTEGEYSTDFFTRKGELRRIKKLRYRRLRDILHDSFQVEPLEADRISDFLSPMLEVDRHKRADARTMLGSSWLHDSAA